MGFWPLPKVVAIAVECDACLAQSVFDVDDLTRANDWWQSHYLPRPRGLLIKFGNRPAKWRDLRRRAS